MATLNTLLNACRTDKMLLTKQVQQQIKLWEKWLIPISEDSPTGNDPGYHDSFQQMREEVNKLSGADTNLIGELAEKLLTSSCKDIRVATYYVWARLHQEGEIGLVEGLTLLAGLLQRFGNNLHPRRENSRKLALDWLAGNRVLDSLALYPEVHKADFRRIVGAMALIEEVIANWVPASKPELGSLYATLENRLAQSGGPDIIIPQNSSSDHHSAPQAADVFTLSPVTSGRDLLDQVKLLAKYLRNQPEGWLSAHHLMKSVRLDTLHQLPPLGIDGRTRLSPPKPENRALLKRLYLQQCWPELLEQTDNLFGQGVNHLWLDIQWYTHQALAKSGDPFESWAKIIQQDLINLITRLPGLEGMAFSDGTPFADEVTMNWINQQIVASSSDWGTKPASPIALEDNDILLLEPEALTLADSEGIEAALDWLQKRPNAQTPRQQWLLRLIMARVAEQCGKNEMALHMLDELDCKATRIPLAEWEPELLFEVKARRLKLLRRKVIRTESDKPRLHNEMEILLAGLIALDPARAAVLCL